MFLGKEMPLPKDTKISYVEDYLEHIEVKKLKERISVKGISLIADLKIKALKQLARGWNLLRPKLRYNEYILHNVVYLNNIFFRLKSTD